MSDTQLGVIVSDGDIFVENNGLWYRVEAMVSELVDANTLYESNTSLGVICTNHGYIFLAKITDNGTPYEELDI